jgi:large subunit ribosomal protein L14e
MNIYENGRLCFKLAGRDAGRKCVIVETVDDKFVVIDGNVRRKKVNIKHLEPLAETVDIKDKASRDDVKAAFKKLGLEVWDKKSKKTAEKPRKVRKKKEKPVEEKPVKKKAEKKEAKKEAEKVEAAEKKEEAPKEQAKEEKSEAKEEAVENKAEEPESKE